MSHEKKIRENLSTLIDLTSSVDEILESLKNKAVLTEEEHEKIATTESPFDKKSQLYYLIAKKDDESFDQLISVLRATDNNEAADKLIEKSPKVQVDSSSVVTEESQGHDDNDEEIAVAQEKEIDEEKVESNKELMQTAAEVVEVFDKEMDEYELADAPTVETDDPQQLESDGDNIIESEVRVEITLAESEPESESNKNEEEEELVNGDELEPKIEVQEEEKEPEIAVNNVVEEEEAPKKQVSFGAVSPDTKEIILNEQEEADESVAATSRRSLVQLNREKFEKTAPGGVKVKYSFKGNEPVEEPKESTVKNLRNFFQKLGSTDKEEAVAKRPGSRTPNGPQRRTMAL